MGKVGKAKAYGVVWAKRLSKARGHYRAEISGREGTYRLAADTSTDCPSVYGADWSFPVPTSHLEGYNLVEWQVVGNIGVHVRWPRRIGLKMSHSRYGEVAGLTASTGSPVNDPVANRGFCGREVAFAADWEVIPTETIVIAGIRLSIEDGLQPCAPYRRFCDAIIPTLANVAGAETAHSEERVGPW